MSGQKKKSAPEDQDDRRSTDTSLATGRAGKRLPGVVRIVGGVWRRSVVNFSAEPGLRPTPERVRETVFDWVSHLLGASNYRALDLFAGSGAMGLEAASRGAAEVLFVEKSRTAARAIAMTLERLQGKASELPAKSVCVLNKDAFDVLQALPAGSFDLIFIDPPYAESLQIDAVRAALPVLSDEGLICVENPDEPMPASVLDALGVVSVRRAAAGAVVCELLAKAGSVLSTFAKTPKEKGRKAKIKAAQARRAQSAALQE